jgi:cell division protein ZapD
MLRIALPADSHFFPEISGGKHRFTVRFLQLTGYSNRPKQTKEDIEFEIACCIM